DLDALRQVHRRAALRAGIALAGVRDLGDVVRRVVARYVDVPHVPTDPVRARDEVRRSGDELIDDDDRVLRAERRAVAGLPPARLDLLDGRRAQAAPRLHDV